MIRMTTRHALTAVKIYEGIFLHNENDPTIVINNTKIIGGPKTTKPVSFSTTTTVPKNNNLLSLTMPAYEPIIIDQNLEELNDAFGIQPKLFLYCNYGLAIFNNEKEIVRKISLIR